MITTLPLDPELVIYIKLTEWQVAHSLSSFYCLRDKSVVVMFSIKLLHHIRKKESEIDISKEILILFPIGKLFFGTIACMRFLFCLVLVFVFFFSFSFNSFLFLQSEDTTTRFSQRISPYYLHPTILTQTEPNAAMTNTCQCHCRLGLQGQGLYLL